MANDINKDVNKDVNKDIDPTRNSRVERFS